jgi:hypothetical protein
LKRAVLLFLCLSALAKASSAGTRSCTNAFVTAGLCRSTADVVYTLPISTTDPDGAGALQAPSALVADAFASLGNWQSPTACTTEMVQAAICSAGQIGAQVAITKAQFVDLSIRAYVLATVRRYRLNQAVAAAQATATSTSDPDVGQ